MADPKMLTNPQLASLREHVKANRFEPGAEGFDEEDENNDAWARTLSRVIDHADAADLALAAKDAEIARLRAALTSIGERVAGGRTVVARDVRWVVNDAMAALAGTP